MTPALVMRVGAIVRAAFDEQDADATQCVAALNALELRDPVARGITGALYHLARSAFPTVVMSTALAASLCATSAPGIVPEWPFEALSIRLPDRLLPVVEPDGTETWLEHVLLCRDPIDLAIPLSVVSEAAGNAADNDPRFGAERRIWVRAMSTRGTMFGHMANYTSDLAKEWRHVQFDGGSIEQEPIDRRSMDMVGRLALGVLLEFEREEHRAKRASGPNKRDRRGPPRAWVFQFCRGVKCDVRAAVTDYCRGGGSSPSVQTLVRGHWKNQVCGQARTGRKRIHVEPYWRGPEDAPIAVRATKIGGAS